MVFEKLMHQHHCGRWSENHNSLSSEGAHQRVWFSVWLFLCLMLENHGSCCRCAATMCWHEYGVIVKWGCLWEDRTYESLVTKPSTSFTLNVRPHLHSAWQLTGTGNWSHKYTKMLVIFTITLKLVIFLCQIKKQSSIIFAIIGLCLIHGSKYIKFLAFICDCHFSFVFFLILLWLETYWSVGFHLGDSFKWVVKSTRNSKFVR